MSSGWNGIGIKTVGRTRRRLADLICAATGHLVVAEDIGRSNPNVQHFEDCCSWDCWGVKRGGGKVHFYSWDNMGSCVKRGIEAIQETPSDYQISAKDNDECPN